MSVEEVRVRLRSGRGYSALLVDDSLLGRRSRPRRAGPRGRLRGARRRQRPSAAAVGRARAPRPCCPTTFERDELLQVLQQVATPITRSTPASPRPPTSPTGGFRGRLVAVTGAAGRGALHDRGRARPGPGQRSPPHRPGVPGRPRARRRPGDAPRLTRRRARAHRARRGHRSGAPSIDDVRGLTWQSPTGATTCCSASAATATGRRCGHGPSRPRSTGCAGVSDRGGRRGRGPRGRAGHRLGRRRGAQHDRPHHDLGRRPRARGRPTGLKGLHSHLRTTRALLAHGVPGARHPPGHQPLAQGPTRPRRAHRAFGTLLGSDGAGVPSPLHLAERRHLDEVHRDGARFPDGWLAPVVTSVQAVLDRDREPDGSPTRCSNRSGRVRSGAGPTTRTRRLALVQRVEDQLPRRQPVLAPALRRHEALVGRPTHAVGAPLLERPLVRRRPSAVCSNHTWALAIASGAAVMTSRQLHRHRSTRITMSRQHGAPGRDRGDPGSRGPRGVEVRLDERPPVADDVAARRLRRPRSTRTNHPARPRPRGERRGGRRLGPVVRRWHRSRAGRGGTIVGDRRRGRRSSWSCWASSRAAPSPRCPAGRRRPAGAPAPPGRP